MARWLADTGALNITRDGNSIVVNHTLFTVCPWWDGPVVCAAWSRSSKPTPAAGRAGAGSGFTTRAAQFTDELVGQ